MHIGRHGKSSIIRAMTAPRRIVIACDKFKGSMMRHAMDHGADQVILGIGGSATNDGGAGMAAALGARFLDHHGNTLEPSPHALADDLARIDMSQLVAPRRVTVACDVDSPLLGPNGATRVFGPQKGADLQSTPILERALAALVRATDGEDEALRPGSGAAGGLGFGLLRFAHATLVPGFDLIASLTNLTEHVASADLVITGEGSLDTQSLAGKGPVGIAKLARQHAKPVWAFCGRADAAARESGLFQRIIDLTSTGLPTGELMARAAYLLETAAAS